MDEQRKTGTGGRDLLAEYRRKRAAGGTPEPMGASTPAGAEKRGIVRKPGVAEAIDLRPGRFVVQQHAARRLHYDLRLEFGGVLHSWAVPKGPSLDPQEKRLAVETEAHPLEYVDFEGLIPQGNYGAGAMIVWDRGVFVPHLDPEEGLATGKQLFELKGYKLRGLWTLVRTKKAGAGGKSEPSKEWLLIKKPDAWGSGEDAADLPAGSVLSGLTVEELAAGEDRAAVIRDELEAAGAPAADLRLVDVQPMLAETADGPFSRPGWLFELKYDGYRLLAAAGAAAAGVETKQAARGAGGRLAALAYRSGRDATAAFPEIARALAALPYASLLLDGEVVVLDDQARPVFARLQQRAMLGRRPDVERAAVEHPATYQVFDLLAFDGFDLRPLPLSRRKELLRSVLPAAGPLRYTDHLEERGEELYAAARGMGLEGLVAKRADAPYRAGRSADWLKVRAGASGDFVVVGFTAPKGGRATGKAHGFGALHLAWMDGARLVYAGRVGSGFTARQQREILAQLDDLRRPEPPLSPRPGEPPVAAGDEHTWVEPRLVVEVRFTEVTTAGHLRHPVFARLRPDKPPGECTAPAGLAAAAGEGGHDEEPPEVKVEPTAPRPEVRLTNLDKVFWSAEEAGDAAEEGSGAEAGVVTKGDLLAYYDAVADHLLPYLADRPVVLDRYPDGIAGKSFFHKHAPEHTPEWVRTEPVWSEEAAEGQRLFVCDDRETLLYLVNLGSVPLHVAAARVAAPQHPDWCILDLDAKDAPFAAAVEVALALRRLTEEAALPAYVKTSGASGLHVLIPLGARVTHEHSRQLAELLARVVASQLPQVASVARLPGARPGKVYVDFLQNGHGKLLVAPYSARPLPGAPVSMPLTWDEVGEGLDPKHFHVRNAPARLAAWKADPLRPVLDEAPDLVAALGRLAARF